MDLNEFGYKQELKRSLTLTDLVVYGMIFMIPIAPFGVYGYVNAQAPGSVPLAYLIAMAAMLFTALSYGSMARAFPMARCIPTRNGVCIRRSASSPVGSCSSITC